MTKQNSIRVDRLVVDHHRGDETIHALNCPALAIDGGTSAAVIGPSGCGKSTLLGVLAGLASPSTGSVLIGKTEITSLSERERVAFRKTHIGIVYQADNLLPFLTVTENVRLQLALSDGEADIEQLLERLGLSGLGDRLPDKLSGGQRQRAAVARAVVHRPDLIFADEPTGALDADNAAGVIDVLTELQRDLGATLIIVTHDRAVAAQMHQVIQLRAGTVIAEVENSHAR